MPCRGGIKQNSSSLHGVRMSTPSSESSIIHQDFDTYNIATEVSWMNPIQQESQQLWEEENQLFSSSSVSNSTELSLSPVKQKTEADSIFTNPFIVLVTVLSCIGNVVIIYLIFSFKKFRKPANMLIANLAFSSILLMVSVNVKYMEYSIDLWTYSNSWCRCLAVLHRVPIVLVALSTITISYDRGRVARNPLARSGCAMRPIWRIFFIWNFSFLIASPLALGRKYDPCISNTYKCAKVLLFNSAAITVAYASVFLFSVYVIPALILIHESVKTYRKIRFLRNSLITWSGNNEITIQITYRDTRLRLLRNSSVFSIIFLVFWLPYGIAQFLLDIPQTLIPESLLAYQQYYVKVLKNFTYMEAVMNPVILFLLSYDVGEYCHRFSLYRMWKEKRCLLTTTA